MSKQRRTADDFVRDMKAKQQQDSTAGDVERKIEGVSRATRPLRDHNGQQLAYIYFEDEPGRRSGGLASQQRQGAASLTTLLAEERRLLVQPRPEARHPKASKRGASLHSRERT